MSGSKSAVRQGILLGGVGLFTLAAAPALAQGFCPGGFPQQGGFCTNGVTGAFSSAALSSSALTEVSQTLTQQSASTTSEAIRRRREEEQRRPAAAAAGTAAGTPAAPRQSTAARPARATAPAPRTGGRDLERVATPYYKAPYIDPTPRSAFWLQAFGDYERWKVNAATANGLGGPGGLGNNIPIALEVVRKVTTWGFVSGADWTFRNVHAGGDTFIAGVLTGYMRAEATFDTTSTSSNTAVVLSGSSRLKATIDAPSVGVFATYANAGFSTDITAKVEFLSINETFSELLPFGAVAGGAGAFLLPISGSGSTRAINYVTFGNVNYRIPVAPDAWWEPTAGFRFTYTDYDDVSAAALGLKDGHILRLQAGARVGTNYNWYNVNVSPVFTGLVYSDVDIKGGAIQNGVFQGPAILPTEQGKIRVQGIGALNFDHRNGMKTFVQADIRGGQDYFGVGGKGGIRFEW